MSDDLINAGFKFTVLGSQGGFLGESNATFLVAVEPDEVAGVVALVEQNSHTREQMVNITPFDIPNPGSLIPSAMSVPVGGSVVFVVDIEQFHRF